MESKKKGKKIRRWIMWSLAIIVAVVIVSSVLVKGRDRGNMYELVSPTPNDEVVMSTVLTGSIEARDEVKVKPEMNGIVSELLHMPGDYVNAGDLVARLSIVPDVASIQNAASRVESARVRLNQLQEVYERDKALYDRQILPKEQLEASEANYKSAQIDLNIAEETLQLVSTGSSSRTAQKNNTMVRATVSGTILEQPIKVGNTVIQANSFNEGTTIISIANLKDLLFVGEVNESDVNKVQVGAEVNIHVGALKDRTFPAVVEYVSPKGVEKSGTILFEVKAALSPEDIEGIKVGFSSNAEVVLGKSENVMTIPESAVVYKDDKTYVMVSKDGGNTEKDFTEQEVTLGLSDGLKVEVKSGLKGTELLRGNPISKKK
ncbi:MAG: efflux RND transporter periplasmic adaptor subunit [Porphyromonas sp.]|nr:efflux RND transporter periplasmic adaptor subunit [Porphyromonas sp.]